MDKYGGGHKDGVFSSFWHYRDALSFTQCCNSGNAPDSSCGSGLCDDRGEYRQDVQGFPSLALLRRRYHFGECFGENADEPVCHARFCHRDEPARRLFRNVVAFWACNSLASTERRTDCWLCRMEQMAMRLRSGRLPWESLQSAECTEAVRSRWSCHPMFLPMDPDEAAEDVVFRERITHAIFVHVESFTGAIIPLRQIIRNLRKVRKDVSICVDNRSGYCLHPMPQLDEVVDYSVFPFLHTDSPDPRDQQVGGIPLFRIHGGAPSRHHRGSAPLPSPRAGLHVQQRHDG